jgi:LysR family transcriptional activator of nhaA
MSIVPAGSRRRALLARGLGRRHLEYDGRVEWLNYHHLLYFWVVAKEGSIARASTLLRLAHPTISSQIHALEDSLGEQLFVRSGRQLVLTEVGQVAFRYADEIFSLGKELTDTLKRRPTGRPLRFVVGIADVMPKVIAHRLIEPALRLAQPVQLICREDDPESLMADLSVHNLDLVLSDAPIGPGVKVRAYNHLLGECDVTVFAAPELAARYTRGFPRSLDGAPFLLPREGTLRRSLDHWLEVQQIEPLVVGEFDDNALLTVFGQAGRGVFVAPSAVGEEVCRQYGVSSIGRVESIRERFYAISVERKIKNPAVAAIAEVARKQLFT